MIKWSTSLGRLLFSRLLSKSLYQRITQRAKWEEAFRTV